MYQGRHTTTRARLGRGWRTCETQRSPVPGRLLLLEQDLLILYPDPRWKTGANSIAIVALAGVVRFGEQNALDQRIELVELGQLHVDVKPEILLELERTTAGRTHGRHQLRHPLRPGQLQEATHLRRRKADEVERTLPTPDHHVVHLQVAVPVAGLTRRMLRRMRASWSSSPGVISFGSKYTSFVSVPPMSMPNHGIAVG
uniref:Uncharacterized protein n=1 Tax=Anopheles farauti TaxID=69004 RepID=A0A182QI18_9DIPT